MKLIRSILRKTLQPVLVGAAALALLATSGRAATFTFETKVPGYSTAGWILVVPELRAQLGGRVTYDRTRARWVTDRVTRGDPIRVTVSPKGLERCRNGGLAGVYSQANPDFFYWGVVALPFSVTTTVTQNPRNDNVFVWAYTSEGYFEKRVPIGTRP